MKNRIKELRNDRDYTQKVVAEKLNITQRKYSYIETGQQFADYDLLIKLARLYHTSVDYLLGVTDVFEPYDNSKQGDTSSSS